MLWQIKITGRWRDGVGPRVLQEAQDWEAEHV